MEEIEHLLSEEKQKNAKLTMELNSAEELTIFKGRLQRKITYAYYCLNMFI